MENRSFYNEILTEHNMHPDFKHDIPDADIVLDGVNPSCGDEIQLKLKTDGDIITDEAAEIQGGVGTAGSANIGKRYAMFEAIHGSAPRMVQEGRAKYADPSSVLRAAVMLLEHIGEIELAKKLDRALDICMVEERKVVVTGRDTGATAQEFTDYVLDTIAKL